MNASSKLATGIATSAIQTSFLKGIRPSMSDHHKRETTTAASLHAHESVHVLNRCSARPRVDLRNSKERKTSVRLSLFQVDAFTDKVFSGNPAAVCPLERWLDDREMLSIAAEDNLSETSFFVPEDGAYRLRWFTPKSEVQLCGHATPATAFVIFNVVQPGTRAVRFETCSGPLEVKQDEDYLTMDFPSLPAKPCADVPRSLLKGLDPAPHVVLETGHTAAERNYFVVYETEEQVRNAKPDFAVLEKLHPAGVCTTAPGKQSDFVSRYFAPSYGIPEDPVTGSTHCTLGPYRSDRLKKDKLHARQVSQRGGDLLVEPRGGASHVKREGRYVPGRVGVILKDGSRHIGLERGCRCKCGRRPEIVPDTAAVDGALARPQM
jgi:PhzF family phenazine biosynthesis protein